MSMNVNEVADKYFGEMYDGFPGMVNPRIKAAFERVVGDALGEKDKEIERLRQRMVDLETKWDA